MLRVNDILSELEGRVGPLEKEAAVRKNIWSFMKRKSARTSRFGFMIPNGLRSEAAEAENQVRLSALELQTADDTIASLEAQNEKLYEAAQSNKLTSDSYCARFASRPTPTTSLTPPSGLPRTIAFMPGS